MKRPYVLFLLLLPLTWPQIAHSAFQINGEGPVYEQGGMGATGPSAGLSGGIVALGASWMRPIGAAEWGCSAYPIWLPYQGMDYVLVTGIPPPPPPWWRSQGTHPTSCEPPGSWVTLWTHWRGSPNPLVAVDRRPHIPQHSFWVKYDPATNRTLLSFWVEGGEPGQWARVDLQNTTVFARGGNFSLPEWRPVPGGDSLFRQYDHGGTAHFNDLDISGVTGYLKVGFGLPPAWVLSGPSDPGQRFAPCRYTCNSGIEYPLR